VYALCRRPKTAVYTASVHGRKRPCTRPVHCGVYEPIWPVHGRIRNTLHGRVRPCRRPVHGRVHGPCIRIHVDTCTRPYTCRVHGRVHGPYMAVYTSRVRGRVRAFPPPIRRRPYRRPVHRHVHGWCRRAVCTAHTRPCTGRVYGTAVTRQCAGRFHGRRRVHEPCTRPPCNGHTTRYTAVYTTRYTAVYTARTPPHNGRLHGRVTDCRLPVHAVYMAV